MEQSDLPDDNANNVCPFCRPKEFKDFESIEDVVFAWLDDNTNTLRNYIYSHASQSIVEDLLRASTFKKSRSLYPSQYGFSRINSLVIPQLKNKQMPIRKISSSEFEPLAFHPILATGYDGCQSFLASPSISCVPPKNEFLDQMPSKTVSTETSGLTSNISPDQEEKPEGLKALADSFKEFYSNEVMKELVLDIWSDSDLSSLCFKILRNACLLLNADRASLFIVEVNSSTGERFLVSKLFDVTAKCTLAEALHKSEAKTVSLPFGVGIVGWVAQTGEAVNISNVYEDPRFNREVDLKTGFHTRCLICMPIKDGEGNVLAVAQVMNKKQQKHADDSDTSLVFSSRDVNLFEAYTSFCGIGLHHAQILFRSQLETRRSQVLLELARLIFSDQSDISRLIYSILMHSQSLLTCQRCQILLVNDLKEDTPNADVFGAAYDYTWKDRELDLNEILKRGHRVEDARFPINTRLACHVARTGEASPPTFSFFHSFTILLPFHSIQFTHLHSIHVKSHHDNAFPVKAIDADSSSPHFTFSLAPAFTSSHSSSSSGRISASLLSHPLHHCCEHVSPFQIMLHNIKHQ